MVVLRHHIDGNESRFFYVTGSVKQGREREREEGRV